MLFTHHNGMNRTSFVLNKAGRTEPGATPRKHAFLPSVTLILIQRLLHKILNSTESGFQVRLHVRSERQSYARNSILAPALTDKLVQYICRDKKCAQGKQSLHSRWDFISTFTEVTVAVATDAHESK